MKKTLFTLALAGICFCSISMASYAVDVTLTKPTIKVNSSQDESAITKKVKEVKTTKDNIEKTQADTKAKAEKAKTDTKAKAEKAKTDSKAKKEAAKKEIKQTKTENENALKSLKNTFKE